MNKLTTKVRYKGETYNIPHGWRIIKHGNIRVGDMAYSVLGDFTEVSVLVGYPVFGRICVIRKVVAKPGPAKPTSFHAMSKKAQDTGVAFISYCMLRDDLWGIGGGRTKKGKPKALRKELTEFLAEYVKE